MIGIMTFHAAHNYGSVLQAYATQKILDDMGYQNEIINYRLKNQIEFYNHFYTMFFGVKQFLRNLTRLPEHNKRNIRRKKFEDFINNRLRLTERSFHTFKELVDANVNYSILVSGSDQIWNRYCSAEFKKEPVDSIYAYYLGFGKKTAARIAISSSFGSSTIQDAIEFKKLLENYDAISVREEDGVDIIHELIGRDVLCTLDPTFFLTKEDWKIEGTYDVPGKYIFVYTLRRKKEVQMILNKVKTKFENTGYKIICLSPFSPVLIKGVDCVADCGPLDFLSYVKSASLVITDSFHGTALSINMEVPFFMIPFGVDKRKELLLKKVCMLSQKMNSFADIDNLDLRSCFNLDYSNCRKILTLERKKSKQFIKDAIGDFYGKD